MDLTQVTSIQYAGTICFVLAILHTFSVKFFQKQAHHFTAGSVGENFFHFLGEVEVVFGIWAAVFISAYALLDTSASAVQYLETRSFTEPLLVFALMAVCASKPILNCATYIIDGLSRLLPLNKSLAFYISALVVGPILGSFITEPAAMTVTALVLLNRLYTQGISLKLKYATLGLLFVNVSIGGTLTSFAAPPVLMVAAKWDWDMAPGALLITEAGGAVTDTRGGAFSYNNMLPKQLSVAAAAPALHAQIIARTRRIVLPLKVLSKNSVQMDPED